MPCSVWVYPCSLVEWFSDFWTQEFAKSGSECCKTGKSCQQEFSGIMILFLDFFLTRVDGLRQRMACTSEEGFLEYQIIRRTFQGRELCFLQYGLTVPFAVFG